MHDLFIIIDATLIESVVVLGALLPATLLLVQKTLVDVEEFFDLAPAPFQSVDTLGRDWLRIPMRLHFIPITGVLASLAACVDVEVIDVDVYIIDPGRCLQILVTTL